MPSISPLPIPASFTSEPAREGWAKAPLATVRETYGKQSYDTALVAARQAVVEAEHGDSHATNEPMFVPAGDSLLEALRFATDRAQRSHAKAQEAYQSQAVLQADSGAYYVTGLDDPDRSRPFDIDNVTSNTGPAARKLEALDLHEDVQAIVGRNSWIAAPGITLPDA